MSVAPFLKMNGIGNHITVLDLRHTKEHVKKDQVRSIATDPRTHFDQLMVLYPPRTPGTEAMLAIFNSDGSEAGACGNGTRCVAHYLFNQLQCNQLILESVNGLLPVRLEDSGDITVDMGKARLAWNEIPLSEPFHDTSNIELQIGPIDDPILDTPSVVNMGNPHAIFWVKDVTDYDMNAIGPLLEHHPIFPEGANITIAQVMAANQLKIITWERGVGVTKACGSAACAAAVAALRKNAATAALRKNKIKNEIITVFLLGGDLMIEWRESDGHVLMSGPCELESQGTLTLNP